MTKRESYIEVVCGRGADGPLLGGLHVAAHIFVRITLGSGSPFTDALRPPTVFPRAAARPLPAAGTSTVATIPPTPAARSRTLPAYLARPARKSATLESRRPARTPSLIRSLLRELSTSPAFPAERVPVATGTAR